MMDTLPSSPRWRSLIDRLRHLLLTEGYGKSSSNLGVVGAARSLRALVSLGPTALEPLIAELPELEHLGLWLALRARIEAGEGDPNQLDALGPGFAEPLLDDQAEPAARVRQLLRRLVYLVEEEFVDAPISNVMFSKAMHEWRRLDHEAELIEAYLDSGNSHEKRLLRFMLRAASEDWSQGDDAWWLARVAEYLDEYPASLTNASSNQLRRFEAIGLIPADFERRIHASAHGYSVPGTTYFVRKRHAGSRGRSLEIGSDLASGKRVLVTTLLVLSGEPLPPADRLALDYEGVAPMLWLGRVETNEGLANVLVEALPKLARSDARSPAPLVEVARLADATACILERVHAGGECVVGLRPELTLVDALGRVTLVPRGELLRRLTWPLGPRVEGQEPPFDDIYLAPELLMGSAPTPASDVFSLSATMVWWSTGKHPFARPTLAERVRAMLSAAPECEGVPEPLRSLAVAGLHSNPGRRPALAELREALGRI
ncbi:hypothetical protein ACNOYE_07165 [Nannocystaceae bacterium ST9]